MGCGEPRTQLGHGFRIAKVGRRPVFDAGHFVGYEDVFGEVPIKPPAERERDKLEKKQAFFERKRINKERLEHQAKGGAFSHGRPTPRASVAEEDALLRAALLPEQTARGHAASACRSQHVQRAHVQHTRASEGAPLSTQVESARRARQYQEASQRLPPVSGEVSTSQSGDWQQQAEWVRTVNRLSDPRESK